jgi:hypothetical protein
MGNSRGAPKECTPRLSYKSIALFLVEYAVAYWHLSIDSLLYLNNIMFFFHLAFSFNHILVHDPEIGQYMLAWQKPLRINPTNKPTIDTILQI